MRWPFAMRSTVEEWRFNYKGVSARLYSALDSRDKEFATLHGYIRAADARAQRAAEGWEGAIAARREDRAEADARYRDLLEKYHALKVVGAAPSEPRGLPPVQRSTKPADVAIDAMVEKFGGSSMLRRTLQRFVNLERQKPNADEDAIADAVVSWRSPDEEDGA